MNNDVFAEEHMTSILKVLGSNPSWIPDFFPRIYFLRSSPVIVDYRICQGFHLVELDLSLLDTNHSQDSTLIQDILPPSGTLHAGLLSSSTSELHTAKNHLVFSTTGYSETGETVVMRGFALVLETNCIRQPKG